MEKLIEVLRRNSLDRLILRDQFLSHHIDGDPHRRRAGSLGATRL